MTNYANPYFLRGNLRIDLNYLLNFHSIVSRNLTPTIENYLTGAPLTVQSIAYDLDDEEIIIGNKWTNSILRKLVEVNNLKEAKYEAKLSNVSIERLVEQKAEELGFASYF